MRVGDRVRCIEPRGRLVRGDTYVISAIDTPHYVQLEGYTDNGGLWIAAARFELLGEQPDVVGPEEMACYVVFYLRRDGSRRALGNTTQEEANNLCRRIVDTGGRVLKKSKVTVQI